MVKRGSKVCFPFELYINFIKRGSKPCCPNMLQYIFKRSSKLRRACKKPPLQTRRAPQARVSYPACLLQLQIVRNDNYFKMHLLRFLVQALFLVQLFQNATSYLGCLLQLQKVTNEFLKFQNASFLVQFFQDATHFWVDIFKAMCTTFYIFEALSFIVSFFGEYKFIIFLSGFFWPSSLGNVIN